MCKRTMFADSTKSFHNFLAEVGVFLFPTRSPRNEFVTVTENRSIFLTLYFCNAACCWREQSRAMARRHQQSKTRNAFGIYIEPYYEAGWSVALRFAGSTHLPCSRIKSFNRSTASTSGILNFTAVLPT